MHSVPVLPSRGAKPVLLVALLAAATLPWTVHPWYDPANDASIYLACARSLVRGHGVEYLGEPFQVRPPGFVALIAPIVAWRGFDAYALNLLVSLWGVITVALLFAWSRERVGTRVAAALALVVWCNPLFQRLCNQNMSDVPGAAFVFLGLLLERWSDEQRSTARELVLGLTIALGAYVRTLVVLLLPAILCARALRRWSSREREPWSAFIRARCAPLLLSTVLVLAPWSIRNALTATSGPAEQTMIKSYGTAMLHTDPGDPSSPTRSLDFFTTRLLERSMYVSSMLGTNFDTEFGEPWSWWVGAIVVALALLELARRRESADLLFAASLAVLLVYFAFDNRLVLPTWLLALPLATSSLRFLASRVVDDRRVKLALLVFMTALAVVRASPRREWEQIALRDSAWREVARGFAAVLKPEQRLASMGGWHYEAFLDRPVYSLGFAFQRARGFKGVEAVFERHAIDAVLVARFDGTSTALLPYLEERYPSQEVAGGGLIFWVRKE